jgi:hypothetical protein
MIPQIMPPPACARCPEPAVLVWGTSWRRDEYACAAHLPGCMTSPAAGIPAGFWCRSVESPALAVPHATGHLATQVARMDRYIDENYGPQT